MRIKLVAAAIAATGVAALGPAPAESMEAPQSREASAPIASASARRLPNVVGMNHQVAQDLLQDRGFFFLRERDCTGRGRLLMWDRNWKVVRQSPRGGKRISTDRTITLCSKKYTD